MRKYYYIVYLYKSYPFDMVKYRERTDAVISPLHPFLWLKSMNPDNKTDVGIWTILNWKEITEEEYKMLN